MACPRASPSASRTARSISALRPRLALLLAAFTAGCGGGSDPLPDPAEPAVAPLPPAAARELVPRVDRLALTLLGNQCEAVIAARELRRTLVREINRGRVPGRLQEPLLSGTNALVDSLRCAGRPPPNRVVSIAVDVDRMIGDSAAAGLRRASRPLDLRIPRSALPPRLDAHSAQAAVGLLFVVLEGASDPRLDDATPGQRAVYALSAVAGEIENGGVGTLVSNPSGALMPEAIRGAALIEASDYRRVLVELRSLFPGGRVPLAQDMRAKALEDVSDEALARLEERWFRLTERDPLSRKYAAYIARHPSQFFRPVKAG